MHFQLAIPHSTVQWQEWPHREGRRNSAWAWFPGVSEARHGFIFDPGVCKCQSIKSPCRGSRYGSGEPVRPSSEAEPHPRGAIGPRARRNLTRGGDQPSGEVGACQCSAMPLERSGVPPEGDRADCLVGRWGHQGRGPSRWAVSYLKRVLGSFAFCFLRKKVGFPWLFRGPLRLSQTPTHLCSLTSFYFEYLFVLKKEFL
jgi:hypothetical protein